MHFFCLVSVNDVCPHSRPVLHDAQDVFALIEVVLLQLMNPEQVQNAVKKAKKDPKVK